MLMQLCARCRKLGAVVVYGNFSKITLSTKKTSVAQVCVVLLRVIVIWLDLFVCFLLFRSSTHITLHTSNRITQGAIYTRYLLDTIRSQPIFSALELAQSHLWESLIFMDAANIAGIPVTEQTLIKVNCYIRVFVFVVVVLLCLCLFFFLYSIGLRFSIFFSILSLF